jgi:phosphohistidine phosphatase
MQLILLRHGIAENGSPDLADAERPLSALGKKRTRRAASGLQALGVEPERILSSSLLRALQTAKIVIDELGLSEERWSRTGTLDPLQPASTFLAHLWARPPSDCTLCVGHAPNLDLILAQLLGGQAHPVSYLGKAGAASLQLYSARRAELNWLLTPRQLRWLRHGS